MLAAEDLFLATSKAKPDETSHILNQTIQGISDLGGENFALADHPSKSGRLIAARFGFQRALFKELLRDGARGTNQRVTVLRRVLDIHGTEDDMPYSLRIAKLIVRDNPQIASNLAFIDEASKIKWNTDPGNPIVDYSLQYVNRGTRMLSVTLQIECLSVKRTDPENIFERLEGDADYYSFTLKPGESRRVSGELRWYGTDDYMPQLKYPPDPDGLIEAHYADGVTSPQSFASGGSSLFAVTPADIRQRLFTGINELIRASREGYVPLRAGVPNVSSFGDVYPSAATLPGAIDATVAFANDRSNVPRAFPQVINTFVRSYDEQRAKDDFNRLVQLLRDTLSNPGSNVGLPYGTVPWRELPGNPHMFLYSPFTISVRDSDIPEDPGLKPGMTLHRIQVSFYGLPVPAADESAGPAIPGTMQGDLTKIIELADNHSLSKLKGEYDPEMEWWTATIQPIPFKDCQIEDGDHDGKFDFNCSIQWKTLEEADALVDQLRQAALKSGASLVRTFNKNGDRFVDLTSPGGSKISVSRSTRGRRLLTSLRISEWTP